MSQIQISTAELQYPGWLKKLLTHPLKGLENYAEVIRKKSARQRRQNTLHLAR